MLARHPKVTIKNPSRIGIWAETQFESESFETKKYNFFDRRERRRRREVWPCFSLSPILVSAILTSTFTFLKVLPIILVNVHFDTIEERERKKFKERIKLWYKKQESTPKSFHWNRFSHTFSTFTSKIKPHLKHPKMKFFVSSTLLIFANCDFPKIILILNLRIIKIVTI